MNANDTFCTGNVQAMKKDSNFFFRVVIMKLCEFAKKFNENCTFARVCCQSESSVVCLSLPNMKIYDAKAVLIPFTAVNYFYEILLHAEYFHC
jgi:hypothetical protein